MGHKPWDRPWKRAAKAKDNRVWRDEVGADEATGVSADQAADALVTHLRPLGEPIGDPPT